VSSKGGIGSSKDECLSPAQLRPQVYGLMVNHVSNERPVLNDPVLDLFVDDIVNDMKGLGPIRLLLKSDAVSDILINDCKPIDVKRAGVLGLSEARIKDEAHLPAVISNMMTSAGGSVDESQPFCDARLLARRRPFQ
jgi:pilus assembly protein CpaF